MTLRPFHVLLSYALCSMPLLASAALESTSHGALSSVAVHYDTPGRQNPPDAPPAPPVVRHVHGNGTFSAAVPSASASSTWGASTLSADVTGSVLEAAYGEPVVDVGNGRPSSEAATRWWDTWTVLGGSGAGTARMTLRYSADFAGDTFLTYVLTQQTANGSAERFRIESGLNGTSSPGDVSTSTPASNAVYSFDLPFQYGQSFQLVSSLRGAQGNACCSSTFESMQVDIDEVALAPGAHLVVASGNPAVYHVTEVPEPGTWAMFLAGLIGLLLARRRASSHTRGRSV